MKFYKTWIGDIVNIEKIINFQIRSSESESRNANKWYIVDAYFSKNNKVEFCEIFAGYFYDDEEPENKFEWSEDYVDMYLELLILFIINLDYPLVTYEQINDDVWSLFIIKVRLTKNKD